MGRGRGKGKKQSSIAAREDAGSGEEEKLPVRRRGRPQKPLKDDIEEDEDVEKIEEEEDSESAKSSVLNKDSKNQPTVENGRKRKRPSQAKLCNCLNIRIGAFLHEINAMSRKCGLEEDG